MGNKRNSFERLSQSVVGRLSREQRGDAARAWCGIEPLERRMLMSVSLLATKANASELKPTSSGKGAFAFVRHGA